MGLVTITHKVDPYCHIQSKQGGNSDIAALMALPLSVTWKDPAAHEEMEHFLIDQSEGVPLKQIVWHRT